MSEEGRDVLDAILIEDERNEGHFVLNAIPELVGAAGPRVIVKIEFAPRGAHVITDRNLIFSPVGLTVLIRGDYHKKKAPPKLCD